MRARLRETRLFELIGIEHREDRPLEAPKAGEINVQGAVALVDFHALNLDAWKRELPTVDQVFASMRVGEAALPAASAARPSRGVSGLYLATVRRMVFRPTGGTDWTTSTEFYLLSPDGRVHRGHGLPEVPGGNLARFDYESARRSDPGNSGTYSASGNRVSITVGDERIAATLTGADELDIRGTKFRRSVK